MRIQVPVLALAVALLLPAGAGAEAASYKDCGQVNTRNGGHARSIQATGGTKCRTARRVARRAKGRKFTAFKFECRPLKVPGDYNKLYGCAKPGTGKGIGFFYKRT